MYSFVKEKYYKAYRVTSCNFFFFNLPYMYGIEISGKYIDAVLSLHVSMKNHVIENAIHY